MDLDLSSPSLLCGFLSTWPEAKVLEEQSFRPSEVGNSCTGGIVAVFGG